VDFFVIIQLITELITIIIRLTVENQYWTGNFTGTVHKWFEYIEITSTYQ